MKKKISEIIGNHPNKTSFYGNWLVSKDVFDGQKKYRILTENDSASANKIIDKIAQQLVEHLVSDSKVKMLIERKKNIYHKYSFENHIEAQGLIPTEGFVKQGNLGEITFIEYLKALEKYDFLVYKLLYNPNVSQSMKGDDILMFDKLNLRNILLGEVKYRGKASVQTIEEILGSFGGNRKLPSSISFITEILYKRNPDIAKELSLIQTEIYNGENSIINGGLLLSDKQAHRVVERHTFQTDYELTQKSLDELIKIFPAYPTKYINKLLGITFSTQTKLREAIQKEIADNGIGNKIERIKEAKKWVSKEYKNVIFEHCNAKVNPSLIFLCIETDNLDKYLEKAFNKAKELLHKPENLPLKKYNGY